MRKVLVIGASSKTSEAIVRHLDSENEHEIYLFALDSAKLVYPPKFEKKSVNYLDKKELKKQVYEIQPGIVINCAALTDVDKCEEDKNLASELNEKLVGNLTRICTVMESKLITFSTDYIFNGQNGPYTETDQPDPINYYGKSKHAGENLCITGSNDYAIIRTNVVFGFSQHQKKSFIDWLIDKFEEGKEFGVIEGQWCNPTLTDDLAQCVSKIISKNRKGVYHAAGTDWVNRYQIAKKVAQVFEFDENLVKPMSAKKLKQKARRPEKAGLVSLKAETDLNVKFASLETALEMYKFQLDQNLRPGYKTKR